MHYVICYDLENDRLRERAAKLLEKNGCLRVQKSVFVAAFMGKKHLAQLQLALRQLFIRNPLPDGDGLLIIPLPDEYAGEVEYFGDNNMRTTLREKMLKIML